MWPFSIPFSINNFYIFHSKFIVWSRSFISERENVADERECFIAGCWAKNIIVEMLWNVSKEIFCFSLSRAFLKCRRKKRKGPQKNIRKENKKKLFEKKNLKSFTSSSRERESSWIGMKSFDTLSPTMKFQSTKEALQLTVMTVVRLN